MLHPGGDGLPEGLVALGLSEAAVEVGADGQEILGLGLRPLGEPIPFLTIISAISSLNVILVLIDKGEVIEEVFSTGARHEEVGAAAAGGG